MECMHVATCTELHAQGYMHWIVCTGQHAQDCMLGAVHNGLHSHSYMQWTTCTGVSALNCIHWTACTGLHGTAFSYILSAIASSGHVCCWIVENLLNYRWKESVRGKMSTEVLALQASRHHVGFLLGLTRGFCCHLILCSVDVMCGEASIVQPVPTLQLPRAASTT